MQELDLRFVCLSVLSVGKLLTVTFAHVHLLTKVIPKTLKKGSLKTHCMFYQGGDMPFLAKIKLKNMAR